MKIITIVGARPQFVKAAVVSRELKKHPDLREIIIHTGQHYDQNMSEIFFDEMMIPKPDINLEIGSGSHGKMTGRMLEKLEEEYQKQNPDMVLVYGDTNSTLAGALAASKLHIPVAHVEAGLRSFNMKMPEEQNRILTDHISSMLLCPTQTAVDNLEKEGVINGVHLTGDVMYDASLFYRKMIKECLVTHPDKYCLITLHRAENTDDPVRLKNIVNSLNNLPLTGILPLHPRTRKMLEQFDLAFNPEKIQVIEPVGFLDMVYLEAHAEFIITDSGGVQKEAYFFHKPCITLRDETEWIETVESGWNRIVGADPDRILKAIHNRSKPGTYPKLYGNGHAGEQIVDLLLG